MIEISYDIPGGYWATWEDPQGKAYSACGDTKREALKGLRFNLVSLRDAARHRQITSGRRADLLNEVLTHISLGEKT